MSRIQFHRPMRAFPPPVSGERVTLPGVPQQHQGNTSSSSWMMLMLPLMSSVTMAAYMISYGKPLLIAIGIFFVIGSVGAGIAMRYQMRNSGRSTKERQRVRYLNHLAEVRRQARQVAAGQRLAAAWTHPSPERLWAISRRRRRVWERRPTDPDFLRVRLGLGRARLATEIQMGNRPDPLGEYDEPTLKAARRLADRAGMVGRQPALVDIGRAGVVSLLGPPERLRSLARSMVCQMAVLHAPDDIAIIVHTAGEDGWEWAKWLPHCHAPQNDDPIRDSVPSDDPGITPMVAADLGALVETIEAELVRAKEARNARRGLLAGSSQDVSAAAGVGQRRRLVAVFDAYDPAAVWARSATVTALLEAAGPECGITVICLVRTEAHEPTRTTVRARVDEHGGLSLEGPREDLRSTIERAVADSADAPMAELIARELAPLQLSEEPDQVLSRTITLADLLGVPDLADFDPSANWLAPDADTVLRLAIGLAGDGEPVELDLKESAQGGMGPHGLIVGATGSGKSELLRTLVTGLAMTHSPELLSLVLIDFKGGATFAGLTELPHVAGLITNLADDLSLVERVRAALHGEQQRRQKMLRDAGNVDSLRDYQIRQAAGLPDINGKPLEPLPYLLIVVDEFGELLSQRNDFIDLFVQIGRVGRSLGMHLLLATQRLEEGRLRGLDSHLSYRICLRTFSAAESRVVIGSPLAYQLPPTPGSAYLKVNESVLQRFRVAHISGPYQDGDTEADGESPITVVIFTLPTAPIPDAEDTARVGLGQVGDASTSVPRIEPKRRTLALLAGPTAMRVVVDRLSRYGQSVHQVWLPPLPPVIPLDAVLGPLADQPGRGWQASLWPGRGRLSFPVGLIDLPFQQRQEPLVLDFARKHGNLALVGAPQSGKSTVLRTLMLSAMLTHTPEEVQFYCVDFGGGSLGPLAVAPHVGAVAGRREPERAVRLVREVLRLVTAREQLFAERGIDSAATMRNTASRVPEGTSTADVFLIIDNWSAARTELEAAEAAVVEIAFRGLGVGVHVLLAANRWADIRMNLRDSIGARLELRLNDPSESEVNRQASRQIATGVPGRGVVAPGVIFHTLAPRLDGLDSMDGSTEAQDEMLIKVAAAWPGATAAPVRLLPDLVHASELAAHPAAARPGGSAPARSGVAIGLSDLDLAPVQLDLTSSDPHLLVLGDAGAGKSVFLRTFMRGLVERCTDAEVRFMVVDYRRGLLDVVPEPYVGAYAGDASAAIEYIRQLAEKLTERRPPTGTSARELRERVWWSGPELYVVVDDYDLVGGGAGSPLAPLVDYVAQSRELGLHIVVARRVAGMNRAAGGDPLLTRVRDLGTTGLLLSGDPHEGALIGMERASAQPPGRARLIQRREPTTLLQIAVSDPGED